MGEYEAIYPGAAKWLFEEAERNSQHVRDMERRAIKLQQEDMRLHRLLPFLLVLAFLVASVIAAFANPYVGGIGLFGTLASVLTAYLTGRASSSDEPQPSPPKPTT